MIVSRILKNCYSIPVKKARDLSNKAKHRPVSLLSALSKVFERLIFDQFSIPTIFLTKFRLVLGRPIVHGMPFLDYCNHGKKNKTVVVILEQFLWTFLKAYDCITHDLLIAKLEA